MRHSTEAQTSKSTDTHFYLCHTLALWQASKNRLFVTWRCLPSGLDCYNVGPDSRCFCGHSYKAHAWYNTKSKRVHCRCPKCDCKGFDYIPGHGSFWPRCVCKHEHGDHRVRGVMGRCHKGRSCSCTGYHTAMSCACGYGWAEHATVIETRKERAASGRPCKTMGGDNVGSASSGAVTDFKALLPGVERVHVIGDAAYGNGGSSGGARALPRYGGAGGGAGAAAGGGGGGRGMLRDSGSSRRAGASAGAWRRNSTGSGSGNGSDSYTGSYNRRRGGRAGSKPGGSSSGYAAAVRSGSIKGGHET